MLHPPEIIIAGITGTLFMTAALYLLTAVTKRNFKVVGVLGTMITCHTTDSKGLSKRPADVITGVLLHYLIGIFFAIIYYYLWDNGIGQPDIGNAILFGFLNGCFAAVWWACFIRFHHDPPKLSVLPYASAVGLSHILFGLGIFLIYHAFDTGTYS